MGSPGDKVRAQKPLMADGGWVGLRGSAGGNVRDRNHLMSVSGKLWGRKFGRRSGFSGRSALVTHKRRQGQQGLHYDARNLPGRQKYLQCVLARDDIYRRGNREFRSDQPAAYYELLLKSQGRLEVGPGKVTAKACHEYIKRLRGDAVAPSLPPGLIAVRDA